MEETAKSGEVKQTTPEQKAKAAEYLRKLGIFKPYIGIVNMSPAKINRMAALIKIIRNGGRK